MTKKYASAKNYEDKLKRVMERLEIKEYNWNYDRYGAWIEFRYKCRKCKSKRRKNSLWF